MKLDCMCQEYVFSWTFLKSGVLLHFYKTVFSMHKSSGTGMFTVSKQLSRLTAFISPQFMLSGCDSGYTNQKFQQRDSYQT